MGKGQRSRKNYAEIQARIEAQRAEKAKKMKLRRTLGITAISVVLAACIIVGCIFGIGAYLENTGYKMHHDVYMTSDNYTISNAVLAYFIKTEETNFVSNNSSSYSQSGLDTALKLKNQQYRGDGYDTWFDYFYSSAANKLKNYVCYAEAAAAEGITLDDADKSGIETTVNNAKKSADEKEMSLDEYLSDTYAVGFNEQDFRECLELSAIAAKYYDKLDKSFTYTDKELAAAYNKSPEKYSVADCIYYTIYSSATDSTPEDEMARLNKKAKKKAEKLASANNQNEFETMIFDLLKAKYADDSDLSDNEIRQQVNNYKKENQEYKAGDEYSENLFKKGAKAGDTFIIADEDGRQYDVYMITKPAYREDYITKNVRHILCAEDDYSDISEALTAAQNMYADIAREDDKEAKFIDYATRHSGDPGSRATGGLYENIRQGQMVAKFNDWCFYRGRKPGDMGIVSSDYGYHVMYFVGNGVPAWQINVINDQKLADFEKTVSELENKHHLNITDKYKELDI